LFFEDLSTILLMFSTGFQLLACSLFLRAWFSTVYRTNGHMLTRYRSTLLLLTGLTVTLLFMSGGNTKISEAHKSPEHR
jgi:hypothetical protein